MGAVRIDLFEFCRRGERLEGEVAVADLPRLVGEVLNSDGGLKWALLGGRDVRGFSVVDLSVSGVVNLRCQRCLGAMQDTVASEVRVAVAADEESADALDEQLTEDSVEVIVGSAEFDVLALVEDEVLLALPPAPRHLACPQTPSLAEVGSAFPEKKVSPFAVLKSLKH